MGKEAGRAKRTHAPRVGVISLGCPKNLVDTETLLARFVAEGYAVTGDPRQADVLVVNTCGFVAEAQAESLAAIQELAAVKAAHPGKKLVVTGCLAQRYGDRLAVDHPAIDLLLGTGQYDRLIPILKEADGTRPGNRVEPPSTRHDPLADRVLATPPHTAYLKIAEGCDNPCAFCVIPALRGPYRSRPPAEVVAEARALARQGVRELVLISQDTTLYGRDLSPRTDLAALLRELAAIDELAWLRLLYLYPTLLTLPLLETIAALPKVLPYLDIPLQHYHSAVLKRMKRAERSESIDQLLARIRTVLPEAVVRTAFIVGFPGESEEEFQALSDFVQRAKFDHVGVFCYSDEEGTAAAAMPDKVPGAVAEARRDQLMALQQGISAARLAAQVGNTVTVLVDGPSRHAPPLLAGRTGGQAPEVDGEVLLADPGRARPGQLVRVRITEAHEYDLVGKVVKK